MEFKKETVGNKTITYDGEEVKRMADALENQLSEYKKNCGLLLEEFNQIQNVLKNKLAHTNASESIKEFQDVYTTVKDKISYRFEELIEDMNDWVNKTKKNIQITKEAIEANKASLEMEMKMRNTYNSSSNS